MEERSVMAWLLGEPLPLESSVTYPEVGGVMRLVLGCCCCWLRLYVLVVLRLVRQRLFATLEPLWLVAWTTAVSRGRW